MSNRKGGRLIETVTRDRTILRADLSDQRLDRTALPTASKHLFETLSDEADRVTKYKRDKLDREHIMTAGSSAILVVVLQLATGLPFDMLTGSYELLRWVLAPTVSLQPFQYSESGIFARVPFARLIFEVSVVGNIGAGIASFFHFLAKGSSMAPAHGSTLGIVLGTDGDGTVDAGYLVDDVPASAIQNVLEMVRPDAAFPAVTASFADLLGMETREQVAESTDTDAWQIAEFRIKEYEPYDALAQHTPATAVLAGETDAGLPLDSIAATLATTDLPVVVQVSITARDKYPGRYERLSHRSEFADITPLAEREWVGALSGVEPSGVDPLTGGADTAPGRGRTLADRATESREKRRLSTLFDVSVRALVVESPSATDDAQTVFERLETSLETVTNAYVTAVTHHRGDPTRRVQPWRPFHPDRILADLDANRVTYSHPYLFFGVVADKLGRTRGNIPLDMETIWTYSALTGAGLDDTARALGPTHQDQTPTGRPPDEQLDPFRAGSGSGSGSGTPGERARSD